MVLTRKRQVLNVLNLWVL